MNVFVLNGSPKKKSDTMHLTRAFIEGLCRDEQQDVTIVDVIEKQIKPCLGCFMCSKNQKGLCIQNDDQNEILEQMKQADILIWSFPLYFYSLPSHLKAVLDRTLPLGKKTMKIENNRIVHVPLVERKKQKHIVICGSGFPYFEKNFSSMKELFHNLYEEVDIFCISETPLLNEPSLGHLCRPLLEKMKAAGIELIRQGNISESTIEELQKPMIPNDMYIHICNQEYK